MPLKKKKLFIYFFFDGEVLTAIKLEWGGGVRALMAMQLKKNNFFAASRTRPKKRMSVINYIIVYEQIYRTKLYILHYYSKSEMMKIRKILNTKFATFTYQNAVSYFTLADILHRMKWQASFT